MTDASAGTREGPHLSGSGSWGWPELLWARHFQQQILVEPHGEALVPAQSDLGKSPPSTRLGTSSSCLPGRSQEDGHCLEGSHALCHQAGPLDSAVLCLRQGWVTCWDVARGALRGERSRQRGAAVRRFGQESHGRSGKHGDGSRGTHWPLGPHPGARSSGCCARVRT